MPLPLLIPIAIIAVGAVTGGTGVALGGKGALDIKTAKDRIKKAGEKYDERRAQSVEKVAETNDAVGVLADQQRRAITDVVLRMSDFLKRNAKNVRDNEKLLVDGLEVAFGAVPNPEMLRTSATTWMGGIVTSVATGAGVSAGVPLAVSTFGAASTGTAISTLSGAAATNATLAALGGGSLAAGGGGMALGAAALNVVTIGPGLLVAGLVVKGEGQKALTHAKEIEATINTQIAKLDETDARLGAIDLRVAELSSLLERLVDLATDALDTLEAEPFDPAAHAARFQHALAMTIAVRDVAATPILDQDGNLTEASEQVTVTYRPFTAEDTHA
ncbi:hypothetical protein ACFVDI_05675 [Nocardioides sp. NPDC057767]|uniref:hypothetical protein n=1 Tax=unclassified Nocardioides TaxID=2615069 RepID=UPI00366D5464